MTDKMTEVIFIEWFKPIIFKPKHIGYISDLSGDES